MTPPVERLPRISVIVPLAPGEDAFAGLAAALGALDARFEVILVAAEGAPAPPPAGPRCAVLSAPRGRASQMNRGAAAASGAWLWFLHADSRFGPEAVEALLAFTARGGPALGWFHLRFADGPRLAALNAWGANLRSRWLGIPFGDQGFVLPAAAFAAMGGFDAAAPYGEDHLLTWAAKRAGVPVLPVGAALGTSARKYARLGWWRTTWLHWRLTAVQAWGAWRGARP